jgi:hypothetical protein
MTGEKPAAQESPDKHKGELHVSHAVQTPFMQKRNEKEEATYLFESLSSCAGGPPGNLGCIFRQQ